MHARGKPIAPDTDLDIIARRTPGFTGADLANVINEGALLTARTNGKQISMGALEEAIDRVMAGPERKSVLLSERERKVIAYHEGGHALVGHAMPHADPVHKVTIIPRGRALGYTSALPTEDKFLVSRAEMLDQLAMLLGGRTAEELIFHEPTTGAANDIEKATQIARGMVTEYGMSERLGARKFGTGDGEPFLGRDMSHGRDYSEEIASSIDEEIRRLIESAHDEAWEVLVEYRDVLDALVTAAAGEGDRGPARGPGDLRDGGQAAVPRLVHRLRQAPALGPPAGAVAQGARAGGRRRRQRPVPDQQRPDGSATTPRGARHPPGDVDEHSDNNG